MNRKRIVAGICVLLGVLLLVATTFAGMSETAGYDTYKAAVKNMTQVKSVTGNFGISVKDNGNVLVEAASQMKASHDTKASSHATTIKTGTEQKTLEMFSQDGKAIMRNNESDVYTVFENKDMKEFRSGRQQYGDRSKEHEEEALKAGEAVIDALVGNLKNYVTLQNKADGMSEVSLQLSNSQIPAVANVLTSLAVKHALDDSKNIYGSKSHQDFDLKINPPKLVDDIRISNVNMKALINKDRYIENQTATVVVTGKDAEGKVHEVTLEVNMALSGFNSTTPDTVDLTGKKVNTVEPEKMREAFRHKDRR